MRFRSWRTCTETYRIVVSNVVLGSESFFQSADYHELGKRSGLLDSQRKHFSCSDISTLHIRNDSCTRHPITPLDPLSALGTVFKTAIYPHPCFRQTHQRDLRRNPCRLCLGVYLPRFCHLIPARRRAPDVYILGRRWRGCCDAVDIAWHRIVRPLFPVPLNLEWSNSGAVLLIQSNIPIGWLYLDANSVKLLTLCYLWSSHKVSIIA